MVYCFLFVFGMYSGFWFKVNIDCRLEVYLFLSQEREVWSRLPLTQNACFCYMWGLVVYGSLFLRYFYRYGVPFLILLGSENVVIAY